MVQIENIILFNFKRFNIMSFKSLGIFLLISNKITLPYLLCLSWFSNVVTKSSASSINSISLSLIILNVP